MDEIKEKLLQFNQTTEQGSYIQARQLLIELKKQIDSLKTQSERVPKILVQLEATIPAECNSVRNGIKEMEESGYHLEPFAFGTWIDTIEKEIKEMRKQLIQLQEEGIEEGLTQIQEQMEQMYEMLEKEVDSKQKVLEMIPLLKEQVTQAEQQLNKLMKETAHVQLSYRINDEELLQQESIRKQMADLKKSSFKLLLMSLNTKSKPIRPFVTWSVTGKKN